MTETGVNYYEGISARQASFSGINDVENRIPDNTSTGDYYEGIQNYEGKTRFRWLGKLAAISLIGLGAYKLISMDGSAVQEAAPPVHQEVIPEAIAPEVASPEVVAINNALAEIKLGQPNNLDALVEALRASDALFAPNDPDRMANMPVGYVKALLPHELRGIAVPYNVAQRTADVERYTALESYAGMLATAKLYQDLIATKYPHMQGEMLRWRDFNGPSHETHNTGIQVDFSGSLGWGITQYSTGSFADKQFSERYNQDFTIDLFTEMSYLQVRGVPAISSILFSDSHVRQVVNDRVQRDFVLVRKYHEDHGHATFVDFGLPMWRPTVRDLPWSDDQDLRIAGLAQEISPEQHSSQHLDFELWILSRQQHTGQLNQVDNLTPPEGFNAEPLTQEAEAHIAKLDITEDRKEFLRKIVPSIATVYREGAKINPVVALTQTSLETGFGNDTLSGSANNYFGMKAGSKWKGPVFNAKTKEEYTPGVTDTIIDGFRVYPDAASSVADYARLIQTAPHYADAVMNHSSIEGYTNGLFNEVDSQGRIIREQGEPGVLSYGTDRGYEQKVFDAIIRYNFESLMNAQLGPARIAAIDGIMEP